MTAPVDLPQLTARIEQTIHRINNHWWNKRARPAAPDLRVLLDSQAALIADLTAARERLAELEGALQSILKVRVEGWENIWAGSNRCQAIARAALNPENSND